MSRPVSEFSEAIRQLVDEDSSVTHVQAVPVLAQMGFEVTDQPSGTKPNRKPPKRISPILAKWLEYQVDYDDPESIEATAKALGLKSKNAVTRIVNEALAVLHDDWEKQANTFNVTKSNYLKAQSGKVSRKPATSTAKAAAAKERQLKKQSKRDRSSTNQMQALQEIESLGGVDVVRQKVDDLLAETQILSTQINELKITCAQRLSESEELKTQAKVKLQEAMNTQEQLEEIEKSASAKLSEMESLQKHLEEVNALLARLSGSAA